MMYNETTSTTGGLLLERGLSAGSAGGEDGDHAYPPQSTGGASFTFADMMAHHPRPSGGMDRSSSDQSAGSILYSKTPLVSNAALGKSSSLIFPTGMDAAKNGSDTSISSSSSTTGGLLRQGSSNNNHHNNSNNNVNIPDQDKALMSKINIILDQCENIRWPLKKKLMLQNLGMAKEHVQFINNFHLDGSPLGNALHKLSLKGNHLGSLPERLVQSLPNLKHLDLSQCHLHTVPTHWHLPQLKSLNLSNNLLRDFLEESILEGLPELHDLNMFGNKVAVLSVPHNPALLSKLETLDLGYNDIAYLPDELDQLRSLRFLKVRNNFLTKIPMRICDMELKSIDVSSNPVAVPPLETCERGICSMKRYYQQMRAEDSHSKAGVEELSRRVMMGGKQRGGKNHHGNNNNHHSGNSNSNNSNHTLTKKKSGGYSGFMKSLSLAKSSPSMLSRKTSPSSTSGNSNSNININTSNHAATPPLPPSTPKATVEAEASTATPLSSNKHNNNPSSVALPSAVPPAAVVKPAAETTSEVSATAEAEPLPPQEMTVNDTLKVIFVGMAMGTFCLAASMIFQTKRSFISHTCYISYFCF